MSLIEDKNKRLSVVSVKNITQSGKGRNIRRKTQLIETLYGQQQPSKKIENTRLRTDYNLIKLRPKKPTKDFQQLFQQNLHLRQQINKLKDQLSKQKGQMYILQKKNKKFVKQINIQFEKQIYWNGSNSYQMTGIKQQYQKLKKQYQLKYQQCKKAKKQSKYLQIQEYKIYLENLQNQNKHLKNRLKKLENLLPKQQSLENQSNKQVLELIIVKLQEKRQRLQNKYWESQTRLKQINQGFKDCNKKIEFLEKLIIQKDNKQHYTQIKCKKLQKQNQSLLKQLQNIKQQLKSTSQKLSSKINQIQQNNYKNYSQQKQIFQKNLSQKQKKIKILQKQVSYLTTLLQYWKPLDQINKGNKINIQHHKKQQNSNKQLIKKQVIKQQQNESEIQILF